MGGCAPAQYTFASMLARPGPNQDFGHAHEFLQMAARQNHRRAQFALGLPQLKKPQALDFWVLASRGCALPIIRR